MKAYLINVNERAITEVVLADDDYMDISRTIGCDLFTVADNFNIKEERGDTLYVDDEGLLTPGKPLFAFTVPGTAPQFLAGNGLVLGIDFSTGESCDVSIPLAELETYVSWTDLVTN
jgi:hypothetical protein